MWKKGWYGFKLNSKYWLKEICILCKKVSLLWGFLYMLLLKVKSSKKQFRESTTYDTLWYLPH